MSTKCSRPSRRSRKLPDRRPASRRCAFSLWRGECPTQRVKSLRLVICGVHNGFMPLSSTTASPEQSRLGLQAAFSFPGFPLSASDLTHATAPAPTKRAALLSPDALDAPARSSHRGSRRSGDSRADEATVHSPQPLELFDSLGTEGAGGATTRPTRRARSKPAPAPAPVSAPQPEAMVQVETRKAPVVEVAPAPAPTPQAPTRPKRNKSTGPAKLFVLDTNVLLHDPMRLFRFEEHDIFLPMIVLEELDGHKKGTTEVARNGRQTSRTLDALAGAAGRRHRQGPEARHHRPPRGRRPAVLPDRPARLHAADQPAPGQGRQPDPGRGAGAARPVRQGPAGQAEAGSGAGVEGHQHARQGARPGPGRRRLPERQDAGRRRPALRRLAARCRPTSGPARARRSRAGRAAAAPSTASAARWCPTCYINQFVYFEAPGEPQHVRPRHRDPRQDRGAQDAQGLQLGQERGLGRRTRATASRTSR